MFLINNKFNIVVTLVQFKFLFMMFIDILDGGSMVFILPVLIALNGSAITNLTIRALFKKMFEEASKNEFKLRSFNNQVEEPFVNKLNFLK